MFTITRGEWQVIFKMAKKSQLGYLLFHCMLDLVVFIVLLLFWAQLEMQFLCVGRKLPFAKISLPLMC